MTSSTNCPSCSAVVTGLICEHCGRLASHVNTAAEESRALEEFRDLLHKLAPGLEKGKPEGTSTAAEIEEEDNLEERAVHLLRTGFIPDHKDIVIEAGIYCIPFLESSLNIGEAARSRLESIVTRLKLLPQDQQTRLAIEEFQAKIKEHRKQERRSNIFYGGGCLLILAMIIIGVVFLFSQC